MKTLEQGNTLEDRKVVTPEEWLEARRALLLKEKELTRFSDDVNRLRRELPWVKVEKNYVFEGPNGKVTLDDLFAGRNQLAIYHFMLGPGWEEGCDGCSFVADHVDGARQHFEHNDLTFVAVSRATLPEIEAFKKRMGWTFTWVSSNESDFNYDYHASYKREDLDSGPVLHNFTVQTLRGEEQPGASIFFRDANGDIYHTYSTYERGLDILLGAHHWLDLTPKGRNETTTMNWVRLHDRYED